MSEKIQRIKYLKNKSEIIKHTTIALCSIFDTYELVLKRTEKEQLAEINLELAELEGKGEGR